MKIFHKINPYSQRGGWDSSSVLWLARFLWSTLQKPWSAIVRAGYSSRTMAAYLRKQGAQVGEYCDIQVSSVGPEPYLVSIGNHVLISKGVFFHTHDGGVWIFRNKMPDIRVYGTITIEDNCLIGKNVQLLPNIRIGRNSIVGANSVVISDIPPNSIVMGVPARVIGSVSKYEEKCIAKWQEQKPPDLYVKEGYEWWTFKVNQQKLRKHLTNLFINQGKPGEKTEK
jgi:acetyltransferase-like isoleucine patch superfamily enzyme